MAGGRPPKEKSFYNALSVALAQVNGVDVAGQRVTKLRTIAEKLVECAEAGESWAIKEVADRIDGKPMQAIEHSGDIGDGSSKDQRDAAFAAALQADAEDRKAKMN